MDGVYANPEGAREITKADAKVGVKTDARLATTVEFLNARAFLGAIGRSERPASP